MFKKIINTGLLVGAVLGFSFHNTKGGFKTDQLKSSRVKTAYTKKWEGMQALLKLKQLNPLGFEIYLRVFKEEDKLEIWAKDKSHTGYQLLKTIPVCAKSGNLGPKRKEGDGQVPEGFYSISAFNPYSNYHLSLKVSYPNKSDLLKAKGRPGGDIMIHGNCVTIGCIPIQNDPIEELYVLCVEAKNRDLHIPVHIYPYKFDHDLSLNKNQNDETRLLWESMKKAYNYFELNHTLPNIAIDKKGNYILQTTTP